MPFRGGDGDVPYIHPPFKIATSWSNGFGIVRDVRSGSRVTRDRAELLQNERDLTTKNGGTTLVSARALCLDRLSRVWLRISGGLNCCQESRRGVV